MREQAYENARTEIHVGKESYDEAARRHGVKLTSLWHRDHGRKSRRDGHESQKKLLTPEELELVKLLKELDSWGLHFDRDFIMARAQDVLNERGSNEVITRSWYKKFRRRFPQLKTQLSERKDLKRSDAEKDPVRFDRAFKNVRHCFYSRLCLTYTLSLNDSILSHITSLLTASLITTRRASCSASIVAAMS
jgi:hypothetical protein